VLERLRRRIRVQYSEGVIDCDFFSIYKVRVTHKGKCESDLLSH
jgi:hypothetical protein